LDVPTTDLYNCKIVRGRSRYHAVDGLIVIRSAMLSNLIARTQLPEGVVASYHWVISGLAKITVTLLRTSDRNKEAALFKGLRKAGPTR
jgi:hypothetical protein